MADVEKVEAALASLKGKIDRLSGQPPDYEAEFAAIRDALQPKAVAAPAKKKGK